MRKITYLGIQIIDLGNGRINISCVYSPPYFDSTLNGLLLKR